jgi:hypothetical protein
MGVSSHRGGLVFTPTEYANFICDRAASKLVDSKSEV